jgi:hypothetical protein
VANACLAPGKGRPEPQGRFCPARLKGLYASLEHDPKKWTPVFGKDHAQTKSWTMIVINPI